MSSSESSSSSLVSVRDRFRDMETKQRSALATANALTASVVRAPGSGRSAAKKAIRMLYGQGVVKNDRAKSRKRSVAMSKWVQGKSLVRVAFKGRTPRYPEEVSLIKPSATMLEKQCDRCPGTRHTDKNPACSATLGRPSPFSDPTKFYNRTDGSEAARFPVMLKNVNFVGRALVGSGVIDLK